MPRAIRVESYSGHTADERPLRFELAGEWLHVVDVVRQWRTPEVMFFRVRGNDGLIYVLRQAHATGEWSLED